MTLLNEVPVEGGWRLLVEANPERLPGELRLASGHATPGEVVAKARQSLEQTLDQLQPAMPAVLDRLKAISPDEGRGEFGLTLGAETGGVVAKGSSEVHFTVSLTWRRPEPPAPARAAVAGRTQHRRQ